VKQEQPGWTALRSDNRNLQNSPSFPVDLKNQIWKNQKAVEGCLPACPACCGIDAMTADPSIDCDYPQSGMIGKGGLRHDWNDHDSGR
jgi:hypothetical protein